jgi:hypothetical protein
MKRERIDAREILLRDRKIRNFIGYLSAFF